MEDRNNQLELALADTMIRITVLEKILVDKGVFTREEWSSVMEEVAKKATEAILAATQSNKSVEDLMRDLELTDQELDQIKA